VVLLREVQEEEEIEVEAIVGGEGGGVVRGGEMLAVTDHLLPLDHSLWVL